MAPIEENVTSHFSLYCWRAPRTMSTHGAKWQDEITKHGGGVEDLRVSWADYPLPGSEWKTRALQGPRSKNLYRATRLHVLVHSPPELHATRGSCRRSVLLMCFTLDERFILVADQTLDVRGTPVSFMSRNPDKPCAATDSSSLRKLV